MTKAFIWIKSQNDIILCSKNIMLSHIPKIHDKISINNYKIQVYDIVYNIDNNQDEINAIIHVDIYGVLI